jgi:hypothetical protein
MTAREEILVAAADVLRRSGRDDFALNDVLVEMCDGPAGTPRQPSGPRHVTDVP